MSFTARKRLALVVAVAMLAAMMVPSTGVAKTGASQARAAAVTGQVIFAPDVYEPADDSTATAPTLPAVSLHTIETSTSGDTWDSTDDVDWFKFSVTATGQPTVISGYFNQTMYSDVHVSVGSISSTSGVYTQLDSNDDMNAGDTYFPYCYFTAPAPGTYYAKIEDWSDYPSSYTLFVSPGDAIRLYGADRFKTAVNVSQFMWDADNTNHWEHAEGLVIANGMNYPDALAGSQLAMQLGMTPMLLTGATSLNADTKAEIERVSKLAYADTDDFPVYILGGPAVVSTSVVNELKALPAVTEVIRLSGSDRFGTAAAISDETSEQVGGCDEAVLVAGMNFADALSAGPFAYAANAPILLSQATTLPAATKAWFAKQASMSTVTVLGGSSVIATSVMDAVQASCPGTQAIVRVFGTDRYQTARFLGARGVQYYGMEGSSTIIVSGQNFPDGLVAATLSQYSDGPLLMTPTAAMSSQVESFTDTYRLDGEPGPIVVGGPMAVSATAFNSINNLWK